MTKLNMFLLSTLLLLTVRSHVNMVCTHSSVEHPSQLNFYFFTYHPTPAAGGSVPGTTTIQAPSGTQSTFPFTSFASLGDITPSLTVDELREVVRNAPIMSDGSGETMESRYGDFAEFICYDGNANVGSVLGGSELPNQRYTQFGDTSNLMTVYIATINEASSGTYLFWTDNTDVNLDSNAGSVVGACIDGEANASQITVNVVSAGSPCSSSSFPSSPDFSSPSSLGEMSLPGTVVQPDCIAELPYRTGIVTCLADGTWDSTVMCSAEPGCANSAYDPNAVSVVGVEAFSSEHQSCNDFTVAQGSVCHVVCEDGEYAPGSYQVACVGNDEWQIVDSGTCLPNSQSDPPSPPVITSVDYDYERMIVTVTFDFTNGENDDLVHSWRVDASNPDLGPQNQLNTVINTGFLELSIPANGVNYQLEQICYTVNVENSVGMATSEQFCVQGTQMTDSPTGSPTAEPTASPTAEPTASPTAKPTASPTAEPTASPTAEPTASPTAEPTASPTAEPTASPTAEPTASPTAEPTASPTVEPTGSPSLSPSKTPSVAPTSNPTRAPTNAPSLSPTRTPTKHPSFQPTETPTKHPSFQPTSQPTETPTKHPSFQPTSQPTRTPTEAPTIGIPNYLTVDDVTDDDIVIIVIVVATAICCCCVCVCVLIGRRKDDEEEEEAKEKEVEITIVGAGSPKRSPTTTSIH